MKCLRGPEKSLPVRGNFFCGHEKNLWQISLFVNLILVFLMRLKPQNFGEIFGETLVVSVGH